VNSWTSNRTVCYLASGKPAVVQYTGPSRFLPDAEGLFRFRSMDDAVRALAAIEAITSSTAERRGHWPKSSSTPAAWSHRFWSDRSTDEAT